MKKVFALMIALTLALCLCACGGGGEETDPNAGLYTCTGIEMMGITMTPEEIFEDGDASIELKSGGKCTFTMEGTSETCDWTLDGDAITVEVEGEPFTGTLADGVIVLDVMGMNMTFEKGE